MTLFKDKEEIVSLIKRADNWTETQVLVARFEKLKSERREFYLTIEDLNLIFKWKLRTQFGRQSKFRAENTNENVMTITKAAFSVSHPKKDYETSLRLKILTSLSGVEIPVASAILTLCYPDRYSVIDFRNWRQIFKVTSRKSNYTVKEYTAYLNIILQLAEKYKMTPQTIDIAIWQKDIELMQKLS